MTTSLEAGREPWPAERRFKVRFSDAASFAAASSCESADLRVAVSQAKRLFFTLSLPPAFAGDLDLENLLDQRLEFFADAYGAEIAEDARWDLDAPPGSFAAPAAADFPSLDDVVAAIGAPEVWASGNRGGGATIAVVDTGVAGSRREIEPWRRAGGWAPFGSRPWSDPVGHGTLCAAIAAGSRAGGGRFSGVAPEARVLACSTRFYDSELSAIYDFLTGLLVQDPGLRLVVTNSFGQRYGSPPSPCGGGDFTAALTETIAAGAAIFFSAGNGHDLAGGRPEHCHPATIGEPKLRPDVFTVGACDLEGELWDYSSRGPAAAPGRPAKPDLVAPVPRHGLVPWGEEERRFPQGWGTSGACPQAAGVAALLWTAEPALSAGEIFQRLRRGARDLGRAPSCQGAGRLDCRSLAGG